MASGALIKQVSLYRSFGGFHGVLVDSREFF
jgi:hypothetical protein